MELKHQLEQKTRPMSLFTLSQRLKLTIGQLGDLRDQRNQIAITQKAASIGLQIQSFTEQGVLILV